MVGALPMARSQLLVLLLAVAATGHAAALSPVAVETFFVKPGERATLRWRGGSSGPLKWIARDYWGRESGRGEATRSEDGVLQATLSLPSGFHDIEFPAAKQRFGVVSLPGFAGEADPFFAIDGALSWLVRDDTVREGLIQALRRSGVAMQRERLSWAAVHQARDRLDWQTDRHYETVRQLHKKHGVQLLDMFHDAPAWMGRLRERYPDDLVAAARSWERIAGRWGRTWSALEVWNEPDIFFGGHLPADQYVAVVKTLAYALVQADVQTPLVGGVFAHFHPEFLDGCAANGMLDYVAAASFHTYGRAPQMAALVGRYRGWLRAHGREGMPLWLTECGRPWRRGPERPPMDQDAASALDIVMKAVEARACGVARYFAFVYPYYDERDNNFGMMGRRGTALRSMAAYAQLVRVLSHRRYLGDLRCDDKSVQRARVFEGEDETVAVLYTGRPDGKGRVKLPLPAARVEGIDGRPLEAGDDGSVPVPDGLCYVWLDRAKLEARLEADTPAMKLWRAARQKAPKRRPPTPVVLRLQLDPDVMKAETKGYRVAPAKQGRLPLTVRAFNLSAQPQGLIPRVRLSPAGDVLAHPAPLRVPAASHADVSWQVDLRAAFEATGRVRAIFSTVEGDSPFSTPLVVDLFGEVTMELLKKRHGDRIPLRIADLGRWQPNAPGHAKMAMSVTPEKHWRLTVTFGEGDPWVYPYFTLPEGVDLGQATALAVRARCHKPAVVRLFLWEGGNVGYLTPDTIVPADGEWHTALVPFDSLRLSTANAPDPNGRLDLARVRRISIGLNSQARDNVLDVSEVLVISQPAGENQ